MTEPAWRAALPAPPKGAELQAAWLTTYDRPNAAFLVEHLLPSLLDLTNAPAESGTERDHFIAELDGHLTRLRGRMSIISSPVSMAGSGEAYPWLWRYVDHFTVGAKKSVVQHAKLWAFHWRHGKDEYLELYVSSTNLTLDAFKGQLQAGWRAIVPVQTKGSAKSWGKLVPFIEALGEASGTTATERLKPLKALLGRTVCPDGVTFVASIPGQLRAAEPLKKLDLSEIHIVAPTVGDWKDTSLAAWAKDVGVPPSKLRLKWVEQSPRWSAGRNWSMPRAVPHVLKKFEVAIDAVPSGFSLAEGHRSDDDRWCHAKLYLLKVKRRAQRKLLVTSANWSAAAWGAGSRPPANFELGVLIDANWCHLEDVDNELEPDDCRVVDAEVQSASVGMLHWAEATWDGQQITVEIQTADQITPVTATVTLAGRGDSLSLTVTSRTGRASWSDPSATPLVAVVRQGEERLDVTVLDLRPAAEFEKTPMPEISPEVAQKLQEAYLLQRYGGAAVEVEPLTVGQPVTRMASAALLAGDYRVAEWVESRAGFAVVDNWAERWKKAAESRSEHERASLRQDGGALARHFRARGTIAGGLIAQELDWHLREGE